MLTINLSELILTVINFFLLLFLLKRFLYTPLITFMDARRARIEEGLEQERAARAALRDEELLYASQRKEGREEAERILYEARTADELRRAELVAQAEAQNMCARKAGKAAEIQKNQEEARQVEEQREQLAVLLADSLLNHFSDMPAVTLGNGLRLAMQKAESTWEQSGSEAGRMGKPAVDERYQTADLFAPEPGAADDAEQRKSREEQRQLDEQWEQLAALLAERLLCPGA